MRRLLFAVACLALAGCSPLGPQAHRYTATGHVHLQRAGVDLDLGTSTAAVTLEPATGLFTADPPKGTASFSAVGVSSDLGFAGTEPIQGRFADGRVNLSVTATVKLSDIRAAGFTLASPPGCAARQPVRVDLSSPPGFDPDRGGELSGTFALPEFEGCELVTVLVNAAVPGPGNTLSLSLVPIQ
ncbi:hypothetical protein [Kutzneria albida]|uniref:Secreted protein n=1 Tax=Kutzneria albida DSM 43870 TaxID=1449976 RepID=W5WND9_9PSEU|nr:hypothetical protein [Kutzneria albida]AHH99664.1 hypothetical protein KALB_6304 [Kutzneria albida DSM 43870]